MGVSSSRWRANNLWWIFSVMIIVVGACSISSGIDEDELLSPVIVEQSFTHQKNVSGSIIYRDSIYVGTSSGIFYLDLEQEKLTRKVSTHFEGDKGFLVSDSKLYFKRAVAIDLDENYTRFYRVEDNWTRFPRLFRTDQHIFSMARYDDTTFVFGSRHGVLIHDTHTDTVIKKGFLYRDYLGDPIVKLLKTKSGLLLSGSHDGIYASTDHGNNWEKISNNISKNRDDIRKLQYGSDGNIYALCADATVLYSTDDGSSWEIYSSIGDIKTYNIQQYLYNGERNQITLIMDEKVILYDVPTKERFIYPMDLPLNDDEILEIDVYQQLGPRRYFLGTDNRFYVIEIPK